MSDIQQIGMAELPLPFPAQNDGRPEHTIGTLAKLFREPLSLAREEIDVPCSQGCGQTIRCMAYFAAVTACDECRAAYDKKERIDRAKTYWESIVPPLFRETDKNHPDFPSGPYEQTRAYIGDRSLFLFGASRKGKTRLGVLLLKRCLLKFNMHVGVLWPEQLKDVRTNPARLQLLEKWGRFDLLLMDDPLLTGAADERIAEWLKDLLDYRMRFKRPNIITSQVGTGEYVEQAKKYAQKGAKPNDALLEALIKRVQEQSEIIPFGDVTIEQPKPEDGALF